MSMPLETNWTSIAQDVGKNGWATMPSLLNSSQCELIREQYSNDALYRSTITMSRYGFGSGEYRYFQYPLPSPIHQLRPQLYPHLSAIANEWNAALGKVERFPDAHDVYLQRCHDAGQTRPTPLILRYSEGDYNCLHQDLYGEQVFPLQIAVLLSEPGRDFDGGEFVMTEQRPRMQSRAHVVPLRQGDGVIFAVNEFPRLGKRGAYRVKMRHGVSEIRKGQRYTLGIIFHDAA